MTLQKVKSHRFFSFFFFWVGLPPLLHQYASVTLEATLLPGFSPSPPPPPPLSPPSFLALLYQGFFFLMQSQFPFLSFSALCLFFPQRVFCSLSPFLSFSSGKGGGGRGGGGGGGGGKGERGGGGEASSDYLHVAVVRIRGWWLSGVAYSIAYCKPDQREAHRDILCVFPRNM